MNVARAPVVVRGSSIIVELLAHYNNTCVALLHVNGQICCAAPDR